MTMRRQWLSPNSSLQKGAGLDLSPATIRNVMADLEEAGLIERTVYPETPPRVEYSLTGRGRELCRVLNDFLRRGQPRG
jgi:DNA-binding HxlR family transcriptional regulator